MGTVGERTTRVDCLSFGRGDLLTFVMTMSAEDNVYMAKLAEQAERYEEMVTYMKGVAQCDKADDLSLEERNLLSVAYKNVVGARRASLRIIVSILSKEQGKEDPSSHLLLIEGYKAKVERELNEICEDILAILEKNLIKDALPAEPKVFYRKMQADYFRYLAEFASNDAKLEHAKD